MADSNRHIAITKKVSLADLSEGWDDCYAIVRPATYREYREFADGKIEDLKPSEQLALEMDIVMNHFVSGKIMVLGDDGEAHLEDMNAEDVQESVPLANKLFFEILGIKLDPKGSVTAA